MTIETPETIWTCKHLGDYGRFFPEAVEAEGAYGGMAVQYTRTDAITPAMAAKVPAMPEMDDRQPWDDDEPDGYLESDLDWARRNPEALDWLISNRTAIRSALRAIAEQEEKV